MNENEKEQPYELIGKFGGFAVKSMIESIEERMAAGETVSAAPSSEAEAELLQTVKQQNKKSSENAEDNALKE